VRILHLVPILGLAGLAVFALDVWFATEEVEFEIEGDLARAALPDLPPLEGLPLSGHVVDPGGQPLRDALVLCSSGGRPYWTHTDADGGFQMDELPVGEHTLLILARGFPTQSRQVLAGDQTLRLQIIERRPEAPRLESQAHSDFHGRLVRPGGPGELQRFENFQVVLLPLGEAQDVRTPIPRWTRVDARGEFTVEAATHGRYRVLLLPDWAADSTWPDLLSPLDGSRTVSLDHPAPDGKEVVLDVIAGAIQGRIFRLGRSPGSTGAPEPIEGAIVVVLPDPSPVLGLAFGPASTDADGEFVIDPLPPGTYEVHVRAGSVERVRQVTVYPGSSTDADFGAFD
jgi:hypothetical protein